MSRWGTPTSAIAAIALMLPGCKCLPVPRSDTTAPTAGVTVEYREPGGLRVSRRMLVGEADIAVEADADDSVVVLYTGGDAQGLRSVALNYDMRRYTGNQLITPMVAPIRADANCPKKSLLGGHEFPSDGLAWRYEISATSTNWLGNTATTAKITIQKK